MNKKAFTLIELLAVIVILAIILVIAVPQILEVIDSSKVNVLVSTEKLVLKSTELYVSKNIENLPANLGDTTEILLSDLISNGYVKDIKSPFNKHDNCGGYILITKVSNDQYDYKPFLNCISNIGNSTQDGLIGYWKLDANIYDYSSNNNHGSISGAVNSDNRFAVSNKSLSFDGVDDSVLIPNSSSLDMSNDYTISMWVYNRASSKAHPTILNRSSQSNSIGFFWIYTSGTFENIINFQYCNGTNVQTISFNNALKMDTWQHITFTYSNTTKVLTFYIDGIQFGTQYTFVNPRSVTAGDVYIGTYQGSSVSYPFYGYIDDVYLYSRMLTANEVKYNYEVQNISN